MQQPKIHISQHNAPPSEKCEYFKVKNYFSELHSDIDKARARFNLGIPDEFSLTWEAITGKPDITVLLNNQKSSIVSQYKLDSLSYDLDTLRSRVLQVENKTASLNSDTLTDLLQLYVDVARNTKDIAALQGGGDTTLAMRVQALENTVSNIGQSYSSHDLDQMEDDIEYLKTHQVAIDTTEIENNISALQAANTLLESRLAALESAVGNNQLVSLTASQSTISVDTTGITQRITITATYTKIKDQDVTSSCEVNSSNPNIATWDDVNNVIQIISEGNTTMTFNYGGKSVSVSIKVGSQEQPQTTYSYIGYASSYQTIFGDSFRVPTLSGTWNQSNITSAIPEGSGVYILWAATTSEIKEIRQYNFILDSSERYGTYTHSDNKTYNIYRIAIVTDTSGEFAITLK